MAPDLPGEVVPEQEEAPVSKVKVPAGWAAHALEPALVENVSVPVVVPVLPTRQVHPATT